MRNLVRESLLATAFITSAVALAAGPASATVSSTPGAVHQVTGKDGCYTVNGSSVAGARTCHNIRGGSGSTTIAISPDGHFAYLVGYGRTSGPPTVVPVLSVFRRDPLTGILHQLTGKAGCFSSDGSSEDGPGTCGNARDLGTGDAQSLTMSADGRFLYVASQYRPGSVPVGGIAIFGRNLTNGTLHQLKGVLGCVSAGGSSEDGPGTCTSAREVDSVSNVHITPDQKYLYASVYDSPPHSGIAIFRRSLTSGTLHQLAGKEGCITDDGTTVQSGATAVCRAMPNLGDPWDVATPDNHFAYVPDNIHNLVQAFRRDSKGGLVPLTGTGACVSDNGTSALGPNTCVNGRGLQDVERAVLSKNKKFIYTNSYRAPSPIAVLNRNRTTGLLSQRAGTAACVSADGTSGDTTEKCRNGRALTGGYAGVLAPGGSFLYFAEWGSGGAGSGFLAFHVSATTGAFSQLTGTAGCVTSGGSSEDGPGTCQKGRAVAGGYQIAISPNGRDLYVSSYSENGVGLFRISG